MYEYTAPWSGVVQPDARRARGKRGLGSQTRTNHTQTTVECLLAAGARQCEDVAAAAAKPTSGTLATVRRVMGGRECARLAMRKIRDAVSGMERYIVGAGGGVSELRALVATARGYSGARQCNTRDRVERGLASTTPPIRLWRAGT